MTPDDFGDLMTFSQPDFCIFPVKYLHIYYSVMSQYLIKT